MRLEVPCGPNDRDRPSLAERIRIDVHAAWLTARDPRCPWHARAIGEQRGGQRQRPLGLVGEAGEQRPSRLCFVATNGRVMVATRRAGPLHIRSRVRQQSQRVRDDDQRAALVEEDGLELGPRVAWVREESRAVLADALRHGIFHQIMLPAVEKRIRRHIQNPHDHRFSTELDHAIGDTGAAPGTVANCVPTVARLVSAPVVAVREPSAIEIWAV